MMSALKAIGANLGGMLRRTRRDNLQTTVLNSKDAAAAAAAVADGLSEGSSTDDGDNEAPVDDPARDGGGVTPRLQHLDTQPKLTDFW